MVVTQTSLPAAFFDDKFRTWTLIALLGLAHVAAAAAERANITPITVRAEWINPQGGHSGT